MATLHSIRNPHSPNPPFPSPRNSASLSHCHPKGGPRKRKGCEDLSSSSHVDSTTVSPDASDHDRSSCSVRIQEARTYSNSSKRPKTAKVPSIGTTTIQQGGTSRRQSIKKAKGKENDRLSPVQEIWRCAERLSHIWTFFNDAFTFPFEDDRPGNQSSVVLWQRAVTDVTNPIIRIHLTAGDIRSRSVKVSST